MGGTDLKFITNHLAALYAFTFSRNGYPIEVRLVIGKIRDTAENVLLTCIEIISALNKREPGLGEYRRKRQRWYQAGIHLLELDLLRRGKRPFYHPQMPKIAYAIALTRTHSGLMDVWPLTLKDTLPILPVPLRFSDPDVVLDLPIAMAQIYEEAAYDLSINYQNQPPPPTLSVEEKKWLELRKNSM